MTTPARRPLTARRDTAVAHPIRTTPIIGRPGDVRRALNHPAVISHGPVQPLPDGRVRVDARLVDLDYQPTRTRTRVTLTPAGRRALTIAARVGGTVAAALTTLAGVGYLVWTVWGTQILSALKLAAAGMAGVAVVAFLWWLIRHGRNGCPGLHCSGCSGH